MLLQPISSCVISWRSFITSLFSTLYLLLNSFRLSIFRHPTPAFAATTTTVALQFPLLPPTNLPGYCLFFCFFNMGCALVKIFLWDVVFFLWHCRSRSPCWIVFRAIKKSKSKSDEDLRNDIKEFLSSVGLPENHLPTMKELSHHGRSEFYGFSRSEVWMQGSNFPVTNALIESCFSSALSYFAVMYNSSIIGHVALSGELDTLFCSLSKSLTYWLVNNLKDNLF